MGRIRRASVSLEVLLIDSFYELKKKHPDNMYSDAYVAALSWFAGWSTRERAIDISMALVKPDIGPSTWEVLATSDNQEVIFNGTVDEFMDMMKERSDNAKPTD